MPGRGNGRPARSLQFNPGCARESRRSLGEMSREPGGETSARRCGGGGNTATGTLPTPARRFDGREGRKPANRVLPQRRRDRGEAPLIRDTTWIRSAQRFRSTWSQSGNCQYYGTDIAAQPQNPSQLRERNLQGSPPFASRCLACLACLKNTFYRADPIDSLPQT